VGITVKLVELVAVPPAVMIEITPVTDPGITMPTSVVPELETTIAVVPPMVKAVGLLKLVPVMVTSVPTGPLVGVKEVMVGEDKGVGELHRAFIDIPVLKNSDINVVKNRNFIYLLFLII
jgi:hypothetical protein